MKVVEQKPNALERGALMGCETFAAWRPELVTAVVSYVEQAMLTPGDHVRNVQPHEFAIAIDPRTLIVYDRKRVESYCVTIVEGGDILVRLDLFNGMEVHTQLGGATSAR